MRSRLVSLIRKEFVQIRRDRRTLAMMVLIPVLWLVIFGYAATFDVRGISVAIGGAPGDAFATRAAQALDSSPYFKVVRTGAGSRGRLQRLIQEGTVSVGIVPPTATSPGEFLADGSDIFTAQTAARQLQVIVQQLGGASPTTPPFTTIILYNPELRSANVMIPGLVGAVMVFIATLMTAVGVVRERERGTLEQLMVTPLRPIELMVGKIVPYFLVAFVDLLVVVAVGVWVFHVPFAGSPLLLFALSLLFLVTCLGIGLLVSTVSQTQQQAMQLAVFTLLPQILLSGFVFPLHAIPWGVRWVSYLMPLTYFLPIARGTFLKAAGMAELWPYAVALTIYAVAVVTAAALQFRRTLL